MGGGCTGAKSQSRYDTMRLPSGVPERNIHSHINLGLAEQFVVWRLTRATRRRSHYRVGFASVLHPGCVFVQTLRARLSYLQQQQQYQWRLIQSDSDGC